MNLTMPLIRSCLPVCLIFLSCAAEAHAQEDAKVRLGQTVTRATQAEKQGKLQVALDEYARAAQLSKEIYGTNHIFYAAMSQAQGNVLRQLGQPERAVPQLELALKIAESLQNKGLAAEAVNNLAAAHWDLGNYLKSQELHERAGQLLQAEYGPNSPQLAVSRNNLAGVASSLGQTAQAEQLYRQAIRVLEANQATFLKELASALNGYSGLLIRQGELTRAEPLQTRAVTLLERGLGPNHYEVGRTLINLGALYTALAQYAKADAAYTRALRIMEATLGPDHPDVAFALTNLAISQQRLKQFDKAEAYYLRAADLRRKTLGEDHPAVALTLHNLAALYTQMKDYDKADHTYQQVLAMREKRLGEDSSYVADTLAAWGRLRVIQKRPDDAEKLYLRALEIRRAKIPEYHPDLGTSEYDLAWLDAGRKKWSDAAARFDTGRRIHRHYIDQVLPMLSESEQLTFLSESDTPNYHAALTLVLKQPENERLAELSAGWVINGKALVQQTMAQRALLARDTTNPALAAIAKQLLVLRKQLASLSLVSSDGKQEAGRREKFEAISRDEQEQSQQLARLGGRPAGSGSWTELDTVRAAIPTDAVLIEIADFKFFDYDVAVPERDKLPSRYVAWIIPAAGKGPVKVVDLGEAGALDVTVREARTALQQAPQQIHENGEPEAEQELRGVLSKLSKQVLEPILSQVGSSREIYLSPDSLLWLIPWSALPLKDERYAIEEFDIRFVVSGRDLVKNAETFKTGQPVLFADPNYDLTPAEIQTATQRIFKDANVAATPVNATTTGRFKLGVAARLPGTKTEADAVLPRLESYAGAKPLVYTDQWALERVFKAMRQPRVLVLSTHGFFQSDEPAAADAGAQTRGASATTAQALSNPLLRCGLLLAGCNQPADTSQGDAEDGILTGLEIVGANLRGTELVVLSACETGLGDVRNGEGVAGLRQSFQLAGAKAVISTLWQIPDRETARLMTDFFTELAESGAKAQSLRQAQLNLIKARRARVEAAHPFFWAAFTLTGE